jgi:hypothetical protein
MLCGGFIPINVAELQLADALPAALFARTVVWSVVMVVGNGLLVSCRNMMNTGAGPVRGQAIFTIGVLVFPKIKVEHEVLDALLLLLCCLPLIDHGNSKGRV